MTGIVAGTVGVGEDTAAVVYGVMVMVSANPPGELHTCQASF